MKRSTLEAVRTILLDGHPHTLVGIQRRLLRQLAGLARVLESLAPEPVAGRLQALQRRGQAPPLRSQGLQARVQAPRQFQVNRRGWVAAPGRWLR